MVQSDAEISVLWVRPATGENVSTRRERIAEHLQQNSVSVTFRTLNISNLLSGMPDILLFNYDVIIANVRLPLYLSFPLTRINRKPIIADVSDPISQISDLPAILFWALKKYEWMVLAKSDHVIFAESESHERAQNRGINSSLVKNSVNFEMFANPSENLKEFARSELLNAGVDLNRPIAIYTGAFLQIYHIQEMIRAASSLTNWQFVFVGERGQEGLVESASSEQENVFYLGSYSHERMPGFLNYADVGMCLVDAERPLKILEYGAANLAVLGMPGKLNKEFSDGKIWIVDPTADYISQGLERILENPREAKRRSSNLREYARSNSWSTAADTYFEAIRKVA